MYRPLIFTGAAMTAAGVLILATGSTGADDTREPRRGQTSHARSTVCDEAIGPDVIVGEIPNVSNYAAVNVSGEWIDAIAIGTTSCNIGDEELMWIEESTEHPVISQNMFRVKDGRIEHIGQSWLKHGFFALQLNACGCGCNPSSSDRLGVGCSDPYGSSLNGGQAGLGPKFEVNAKTGEFPWPFTDIDETGSTIYKRLQLRSDDIDPAQNEGALYFAEAHYIAADDAAAGNDYNNASYRQAIVSGGTHPNFFIGLTGSTVRELPAIYAWQAVHPDVTIQEFDDPEGGRIFLGTRVWEKEPGIWHYEYAVHNYNSDRSVRRLIVPVHPEATISNIGFHQVRYHSGEPYEDSGWRTIYSEGDSQISWSTSLYSETVNANAIRWATMYNFRFEADTEPEEMMGSVSWFKPRVGQDDETSIMLIGPGSPTNCAGDVTGDGFVNVGDLLEVIANWGSDGSVGGDANGDGIVNVQDLLMVIANWGNEC